MCRFAGGAGRIYDVCVSASLPASLLPFPSLSGATRVFFAKGDGPVRPLRPTYRAVYTAGRGFSVIPRARVYGHVWRRFVLVNWRVIVDACSEIRHPLRPQVDVIKSLRVIGSTIRGRGFPQSRPCRL